MDPALLVPVLIVFIVVGLPVLGATLIKLAKIIKGVPEGANSGGNGGKSSREEAEIMQDIHRTVSKLEKRIDALETIVLEKTSR